MIMSMPVITTINMIIGMIVSLVMMTFIFEACHLETQLYVLALLQEGCANPIVWLTVGVINLPGLPEMMQDLDPIAVAALQDAAV